MRTIIQLIIGLVAILVATADGAHAQSEVDRLREALRSATAQSRALEDQRTALQAKIAAAERDKTALKGQLDAAKAKARQIEKDYREAVTQFNERLEERNQVLEKWKEAYAEAAGVARAKDAERAKFEAEAAATKTGLTACTDMNRKLVTVGRELLAHYENVTLGDAILAQEPLVGVRRVRVQNLLQDYAEKVQTATVPPQRGTATKSKP
ncbi:hypothetical protein [Hyphomicrobium sp. CS1BSMeth3]|uniref:hypothetical protein n=1 Tax=Hyphomicrobium sp. CS1BSMeth3 TaxID=1892844 RepID=UPI000930C38E|nr:hypothetical protein [Hyphomicrobium sp. CS1BSMeth3]